MSEDQVSSACGGSFKASCSPDVPRELLATTGGSEKKPERGWRAQKAAGRRFRFLATTSSSLQLATKRFLRRFNGCPCLSVLKVHPEASCHGVRARSPACVRDQFRRVRGGLRPFRSADFGLAHGSCGIEPTQLAPVELEPTPLDHPLETNPLGLPFNPRSRQRAATWHRRGA